MRAIVTKLDGAAIQARRGIRWAWVAQISHDSPPWTGWTFSEIKATPSLPTNKTGASLVAQCLGVCLPMQGTWVRVLVREDPTCRGTAESLRHSCWACALEPALWSRRSTTGEATAMRGPCTAAGSGLRSPQLEKARVQQRRPSAAKNKINKLIKKKQNPEPLKTKQNKTEVLWTREKGVCIK